MDEGCIPYRCRPCKEWKLKAVPRVEGEEDRSWFKVSKSVVAVRGRQFSEHVTELAAPLDIEESPRLPVLPKSGKIPWGWYWWWWWPRLELGRCEKGPSLRVLDERCQPLPCASRSWACSQW